MTQTTRELTDRQIDLLHSIFWKTDRLATYTNIAMAANRGEIKRVDEQDATYLLLQHIYDVVEQIISQFDQLQDEIGIVFHQEGWRIEEPPAEREAVEEKAVD
jgi:hypothetical protein